MVKTPATYVLAEDVLAEPVGDLAKLIGSMVVGRHREDLVELLKGQGLGL